jgi:hypothetical protein
MKLHQLAVVIGSGVVRTSMLYHLRKFGGTHFTICLYFENVVKSDHPPYDPSGERIRA